MAVAEHPLFPRFNTSCVPESSFYFDFDNTQRSSAPGADTSIVRQSRPYWYCNLSGIECNTRQKDEILAILWRQRKAVPVLMRVAPFCEVGTILRYDVTDNRPIVQPAYLGHNNGGTISLQIKKRLLVPGYETEYQYYNVTKPHIDYPARYGIGETAYGPIVYDPMPELKLYVGGNFVEVARGQWSVDKNTGIITTAVVGDLYVTGGFYIPMLLPTIEFAPKGGLWVVKNSPRMEEPKSSSAYSSS